MSANPLPQADARLDALREEQRRRFQKGERGVLAELLGRHPEFAADAPRAAALVFQEIVLREQAGEAPDIEEYQKRFPGLVEHLGCLIRDDLGSSLAVTVPDSAAPDAAPPSPSLGDYELLEEVGRGGMGVVYKARHLRLGHIVALKLIRAGEQASADDLRRFRLEAETAARLRHPALVAVHDVGEADGRVYFAMDFLEGRSLAVRLRKEPLPPADAARCVRTLAGAVQYAHEQGVLHRDLKPANVLLDGDGRPYITDFGLAKRLAGGEALTATGQTLGTPAYMAPEQASGSRGAVGPASDVYGLGAILYECLTGKPPFEAATPFDILAQVASSEPAPPRSHNLAVPRDLETICLRCLQKEPARRYASARALADDLGRFLDGRPVLARPVSQAERLGRWCRRNPVVALLTTTAVVLLAGFAFVSYRRAQDRQYETLLQKAQLARVPPRQGEWSETAWKHVAEAARFRRDVVVRTQAAAVLNGLDAPFDFRRSGWEASSVAFDPSGRWLLLGGTDASGKWPAKEARLLDTENKEIVNFGLPGAGPVTFIGETPVQVVPDKEGGLTIWDVSRGRAVRSLRPIPEGAGGAVPSVARGLLGLPVVTVTEGGAWVAAAFAGAPGSRVVVWNGATGEPRFQVPLAATALALAPDGTVLAAGDEGGNLSVWRLATSQREATFQAARDRITSLAFRPDLRQLAVGDGAGAVTLWDWRERRSVFCPGTGDGVFALVYSADGTTLVSAGRGVPKVWDTATGRRLLDLNGWDFAAGLAFSPDGERLALCSVRGFIEGGTTVFLLKDDRGIRTLRGLTGRVARVCFSPDGGRLAAYSRPREVGVWETATGRLLAALDGPDAETEENVDFAFGPGGEQLACSGRGETRLWDLKTQKIRDSWRMPEGLVDRVRVRPDGRLVLFRAEREKAAGTWTHSLRELLPGGKERLLSEGREFGGRVFDATATPDGGLFIAVGRAAEEASHVIRAYDGTTGKERWKQPSGQTANYDNIYLDPEGRLLVGAYPGLLRDAATGARVEEGPFARGIPGPAARFSLVPCSDEDSLRDYPGFALLLPPNPAAVIGLGINTRPVFRPECSRDGRWIAWGNEDGSVSLCDLPLLRQRLRAAGLDW